MLQVGQNKNWEAKAPPMQEAWIFWLKVVKNKEQTTLQQKVNE